MSKISYIIPYRKSNDKRERNLLIAVEWLNINFPDFELIIVECGTESSGIEKLIKRRKFKHIFEKSDDIFNRSHTRNVGALNASGDILIFSDADLIMKPDHIIQCMIECEKNYQVVNPCTICIDLTEDDIMDFNMNWNALYKVAEGKITNTDQHREDMNFAAGIMMIRKKEFFSIGGWPEELIGWGGEDDIVSYKIDRYLSNKTFKFAVYHLPHDRSVYDWYSNPEYENNCKKMNELFRLSDELLTKDCNDRKNKLLEYENTVMSEEERKVIRKYQLPTIKGNRILEQGNDSIQAYPMHVD